MIKICLMKLGIKWMWSHKSKYILTWISFAIVTAVLVTIYSISYGMTSNCIKKITDSSLKYQIHVENQRMFEGRLVSDITEERANEIKNELNATDMRILYKNDLAVFKIGDKQIEDSKSKIISFNNNCPIVLPNDDIEIISGNVNNLDKNNMAVVTKEFLSDYTLTKDILGEKITLYNDNGEFIEYEIAAVISINNDENILKEHSIYVSYDISQQPYLVTYDFLKDTDMESKLEQIKKLKYVYASNIDTANEWEAVAVSYRTITTILGIFLIIISLICLINSIIITVNEKMPFLNMFSLIGLTNSNKIFLISFIAGLQGFIGSVIGVLITLLANKPIAKLVNFYEIKFFEKKIMFTMDIKIICAVLVSYVLASILTGYIVYRTTLNKSLILSSEMELV